jgi:hypothetical protein
MADYFTHFSFTLPLNDEVQKQYALNLAQLASDQRHEDTPLPSDFPESLRDVLEDWLFEVENGDDGLWLHSESGGMDAVCAFVQHLLVKFDTVAFIAFEWSHDCSKPRTDAYGGGAAVITKTAIETMNTSDWIRSKTT